MALHHYHKDKRGQLRICGCPSCCPSVDKNMPQWQHFKDPDGNTHYLRPLSGKIINWVKSESGKWVAIDHPLPIVLDN